ncbi:hypothetical protein [Bacteriophage sp. 438212]|nr:hypothetical protein [Bacteriophage sp. 438212]
MSDFVPTATELQLAQMVAVWRQGEAARHDPVLVNMLARHAATLNRIAPGAAEKVLAAFEDMKAQGLSLRAASGDHT